MCLSILPKGKPYETNCKCKIPLKHTDTVVSSHVEMWPHKGVRPGGGGLLIKYNDK